MSNRVEKLIHSRVFIIVLILVFICITLLFGTYAWFTWSSTDNASLTMSIGKMADVFFSNGNQINSGLTPVFEYTDGLSTKFSIDNRSTSWLNYNIKLNITSIASELRSTDVKYVLTKNNKIVSEGDLSTATDGSTITVDSGSLAYGVTSYMFYLYIDANVENDPSMMNKTIVGTITVDAEEAPYRNLIEHITNLYTNNNPTLITHSKDDGTSDTYYYSYQDADNLWGLMNDGLKVSSTEGAGATVITDTTSLTSGTEGNIRYFGPSDSVNNYIYFNCSNYSDTSTCEKWRIIGIVDRKVKIIREESIGNLAWDYDKNQDSSLTTYSNNWETSSLQLFLNGLYYNRGTTTSHTYYSGWEGLTTTTLDLATLGITEATRTNNLISESTWYLGGHAGYYSEDNVVYQNEIYIYERTNQVGTTIYNSNPFTIETKIGLMYASDYVYASDLKICSSSIHLYDADEACIKNNWLYNKEQDWVITPGSEGYVWHVSSSGYVGHNIGGPSGLEYYDYEVRPVLYLNSELTIGSEEDGSSTNPYRINVS